MCVCLSVCVCVCACGVTVTEGTNTGPYGRCQRGSHGPTGGEPPLTPGAPSAAGSANRTQPNANYFMCHWMKAELQELAFLSTEKERERERKKKKRNFLSNKYAGMGC